jgi:para-nitrobenzyl esterase
MKKLWVKTLSFTGWLVTAAALIAPCSAQVLTATVTGGKLEGVLADGIVSFKGIPFAAPPIGARRWKSPQPLEPWERTKRADTFGPSCMQDPNFAQLFGAPPAIGEDCLYLNVWTSAKQAGEKLPVMVWIYGGGFVGGMTSVPAYDGTHFAKRGVVLVSIAYRVGAFGFLAHPELSRESGMGSGNYGIEDQIAGLHWVKANIAQFGGDPGRVTIFGESAGGISVSMLAASPLAKGLFQRVISESGGSFAPARRDMEGGENVPPLDVAEALGQKFLAKLGAQHIGEARALSAQALQQALGPGLQTGFWPVFDGHVLLGDQYELYESGRFNDTPVLIGTNSNEGALFIQKMSAAMFEPPIRAAYGAKADAILAAYPHATDAQALQAARDIARDSLFGWHTWAWARLQSQKGKGKAYVYYFDHRTPQAPNGATHGAEIVYVFGTLGGAGGGPAGLAGPVRPEDAATSERIMSYWVNFAKSGDPNGSGLPAWQAFSNSAQQVMYLDGESGARALPNRPQLEALDAYYAWRRAEAKKSHD